LNWLRENVGYVGQEPVLFATTIRENLRYGKKNATQVEMWEALEKANAKNFVSNLENKLDTFVGSSGSQLSGGQKQRICIARAILKNPKILLLDEATSALDRANEISIQQTLDKVSEGRTTICVAHRLTSVQNSDKIIVLDKGVVVGEGKHSDLI
jgi:ATP-binding cassette, subfamily B (MDR/TAP), member 1